MDQIYKKLLFVVCSGLILNTVFANEAPSLSKNNSVLNPYVPHVYLNGYGGSGAANWLGSGDILAPIFLRDDRNLFLYGQARYSDYLDEGDSHPYTATFGSGYRQIINSRLYGFYVLADYLNSEHGYKYWDISPGFETLGKIDFRVNGYIPLGDTKQEYNHYEFDHFAGNNEYDRFYQGYEEQGAGADAEIGTKLFSIKHMPIKAYVNGYYFNTEDQGDITGIGGRITFQPTRYLTLEVKDSYDNVQHNVIMGGIRIYLNALSQGMGNTQVDNQGIQPRLYDQIERNFGEIGTGSNATFANTTQQYKGTVVTKDHIIFIEENNNATAESGASLGDGTFENPLVYFDNGPMAGASSMQAIVDAAHILYPDYSYLYFGPGTYDMGSAAIILYDNQSVWGRSADYEIPAPDPTTVTFWGSFDLINVNNIGFNDLQLLNRSGAFDYGININGAKANSTFIFNDIIVGEGIAGGYAFRDAVYVHNVATTINLDVDKSNFYGIGNASLNGVGFQINNSLGDINISIDQSNFYGEGGVFIGGIDLYPEAFYIYNTGSGIIDIANITNSQFSNGGGYWMAYTFYINNNANQDITIGAITNSDFVNANNGSVFEIDSYANGGVNINTISDSTFDGADTDFIIYTAGDGGIDVGTISNSSFDGHSEAFSISAGGNGGIHFDTISGSTFQGYISAAYFQNYGTGPLYIGTIENSDFNGDHGGTAFGAYGYNIDIETISNTGMLAPGGNYGFYLGNDNAAYIGSISNGSDILGGLYAFSITSSGNLTIDTISDSSIHGASGVQAYIYGGDFTINHIINSYFFGWSYAFYVEVDHSPANVNIGEITNSTMEGNNFWGVGFYVVGSPNTSIDIGNITDSHFGNPAQQGYKGFAIEYPSGSPGTINIGDITNSTFRGNDLYFASPAYGLYIYAPGAPSITFGTISNSSFTTKLTTNPRYGFYIDTSGGGTNLYFDGITSSTFSGFTRSFQLYGINNVFVDGIIPSYDVTTVGGFDSFFDDILNNNGNTLTGTACAGAICRTP